MAYTPNTKRASKVKPSTKARGFATYPASELGKSGRRIFDETVKGAKNEAWRRFYGIRDEIVRGATGKSWSPVALVAAEVLRQKYASRIQKFGAQFFKFDPGSAKDYEAFMEKIISQELGLGAQDSGVTPHVSLLSAECGPTVQDAPGALGLAGNLYRDRWHVNDGGSNKQLQLAKDLWKLRTVPIYETQYGTKEGSGFRYGASQISQCGINRRGWYLPWQDASRFQNYISANANSKDLVYDAVGTLQSRHLYKFWVDNISDSIFEYLSDYNTGNVELYLPLESTWSTHQLQNRLTQSNVIVSAYLVRCTRDWIGHPLRTVYDWSVDPDPGMGLNPLENMAPMRSPDDRTYYWPRQQRAVKVGDQNSATSTTTWDAETATRPAVTPSLSPLFKNHFEIVDVLHKELEPHDTWELTFKRTFKRPLKWSTFKGEYAGKEPFSDTATWDTHSKGDYDIFFSFAGGPGSCSGYGMGKTTDPQGTGKPEDFEVETLGAITVDNHRCRISKTVKHSLSVAWPVVYSEGQASDPPPTQLTEQGFISVSERLPSCLATTDKFDRTITVSGKDFLVQNWPAIGSQSAVGVIGTTESRVQGDPQKTFGDEL